MHLFLSPHLDDAALSCGGQIAQLARSGQCVRVVTVLAGDAPHIAADTAFVRELYARWGLGENPSALRRAEDLAALKTLGLCEQDIVHLTFPDCVYRLGRMGGPLYPTRDAIFGKVAEVEAPWISQIAQAFERLNVPRDARVYLPLTAGHHVDHQIVRVAGEQWVNSQLSIANSQFSIENWQLTYYEEYPYAEKPKEVSVAGSGQELEPELIELDEAALAAKVEAIACYRSQLSSFFKDEAEMAARVRAYAETVGAGRPAERLWKRAATASPFRADARPATLHQLAQI
jgi:LmbE family N-acetylglucosaminyl deacetylase